MRVLALSTSTVRGSVALVEDGRVLGADCYQDLQGHAERIFAAIDRTFALASVPSSAPCGFACDIGPGSFTGVRVGVASAKGIALARAAPLVGVISLEAMAAAAFVEGGAQAGDIVLSTIDAKKGEVFVAAYTSDLRTVMPPRHMARQALPAIAEELAAEASGAPRRLLITGEIATEFSALESLVARGPALDFPDAAWIGRLALARLAAGGDFDPAGIEPLYVRAPDAKPPT